MPSEYDIQQQCEDLSGSQTPESLSAGSSATILTRIAWIESCNYHNDLEKRAEVGMADSDSGGWIQVEVCSKSGKMLLCPWQDGDDGTSEEYTMCVQKNSENQWGQHLLSLESVHQRTKQHA